MQENLYIRKRERKMEKKKWEKPEIALEGAIPEKKVMEPI